MTTTLTDHITWTMYEYPKIEVPSTLQWNSDDPLTVKLSFHVGLELPVDWLVGRDLFHDSITKNTAGYADVQIAVVDDRMLMTLDSPAGSAKFVTRASDIGMFLARTYNVVKRDAETYDMDATIAQILAEQA